MDETDRMIVRAMTLIMDNNDAGRYEEIVTAAKDAIAQSGGSTPPSLDEYRRGYESGDGRPSYVRVVGGAVADLLDQWLDDVQMDEWWKSILVDVLNLYAWSVRDALGEHYLPEPDDMADVLADD